jgi:hypothetical protein
METDMSDPDTTSIARAIAEGLDSTTVRLEGWDHLLTHVSGTVMKLREVDTSEYSDQANRIIRIRVEYVDD